MVLQFVQIVAAVLILDFVGFWRLGNWSRSFRGHGPKFTYREMMFPRLYLTLLGCVSLLWAMQLTDDAVGVALFCAAMVLICGPVVYLYVKAWNMRRDGGA